jgi:hypothetical protein
MSDTCKWKVIFPYEDDEVRLLSSNNVRVCYSVSFSRRSNTVFEDGINHIRQTFLDNHRAFDGRNYRLAGLEFEEDVLNINIGPTTYADYIAFRSIPDILQGISDSSDRVTEFLPNVIGNVGILLTRDGTTFGVVRSDEVSTYRGYLDFPGGHPEFNRVEKAMRIPNRSELDHGDLHRNELFDAVIREVIEDLCIENLSLDEPLMFSILLNAEDVLKPDMAFLITTSHTKEEIIDCFFSNDRNHYEVVDIVSFNPMEFNTKLSKYKMTPIMEGSISVLHRLGRSGLEKYLCEAR